MKKLPDVSSISAKFLSQKTSDVILVFTGYVCGKQLRIIMSKDGLAIYTLDILIIRYVKMCQKMLKVFFESLFIKVYTSSREVITWEKCRPPSCSSLFSFFKVFNEVIEFMHQQPCEIILMGDFNINLLISG